MVSGILKSVGTCLLTAAVIFTGCRALEPRKVEICPGAQSKQQLLSRLSARSKTVQGFRAHGECFLDYSQKGKRHKEHFPLKLWVNPPFEFYMQGDVAFDPDAIVIGANKEQFWFIIKPDPDSYCWGRWEDQNDFGDVKFNPRVLLEAVTGVTFENRADWQLANEGPYDILTKTNKAGKVTKRIYVYCCRGSVDRIEYYSANQGRLITTKLSRYTEVSGRFQIPSLIRISYSPAEDASEQIELKIKLNSAKSMQYTEQQREVIFNRPSAEKFENVYRIIEGCQIQR